jgi:hypothetical protein
LRENTIAQFYMITNRDVSDEGLGSDEAELSYFTSDSDDLVNFGNWSSITADRFKKIIIVLQEAMNTAWERKNKPLSVSLANQLLMVAADVDNDLFKLGENVGAADGEGIANLTYRISALYSPRDPVLGVSAGLKHFGKRRLGRSGLDPTYPVPDNVWDMDCTGLFPSATPAADVHSAYFASPKVIEKMRSILQGLDRSLIDEE